MDPRKAKLERFRNRKKNSIKKVCAASVAANKLKFDVKILNRQDHETDYSDVVPANATLNSTTGAE
jgi:hypothetical protein